MIALLLLLPQRRASSDDAPVTLEKIIEVWKAREQKIKSFDFRWWSKHFESEPDVGLRNQDPREPKAPARPDTTFIVMSRFATDMKDNQVRTRLDDRGQQWSPNVGEFLERTRVDILDHGVEKSFYSNSDRGFFPTLDTRSSPGLVDHHDIRSRALRLAFRPLTGPIAVCPGKPELVEIADKDAPGLLVVDHQVWVDPDKDFLPVRYTLGIPNSLHSEVEIAYARDETFGWVPQSWTSRQYDSKGKMFASDEAKVLKYSLNKPLADADFELDLPPDTVIYDRTSGDAYIVHRGGQRQRISFNMFEEDPVIPQPPAK